MSMWVTLQSSTLAFTLKCLEEVCVKVVVSSGPAQPLFLSVLFSSVPHKNFILFLMQMELFIFLPTFFFFFFSIFTA